MSKIDFWLRLYRSNNPIVCKRAVEGLTPHLEQVPLEILLELLDDPRFDVRGDVGRALYGRRDECLAGEMRRRLSAENPTVRSIACGVLGKLRCTDALREILPLLSDECGLVRRSAAFTVSTLIGSDELQELTTTLPETEADLLGWARRSTEPTSAGVTCSEDEVLVSQVLGGLSERAQRHGIQSLSEPELTVFLPHWAAGIAGNGGFEYFFEGATAIWEVAAAFERLGLSDAARACRLAGEQVPSTVLSGGYERCRDWMDNFPDQQLERMFERANNLFPGEPDEINAKLATYVRKHGLADQHHENTVD